MNAALAGHYGAPVVMASGDQTACAQMTDQLGSLETVIVKQATGRFSAECLPPSVTQEMIAQAAQRAVKRLIKKDAPKPFIVKSPVKIAVRFVSSDMADRAMHMPGVQREGLKLTFSANEMPAAYSAFRSLALMSYPR